jgi:hypothetical protein
MLVSGERGQRLKMLRKTQENMQIWWEVAVRERNEKLNILP